MKTVFVILVFLCHSLFAGTPTEALKAFQQAVKDQKFEDAWKRTAQFDGASEEVTQYLKSRIERILNLSATGWGFDILDEKISGDCAVLVINEIKSAGQTALNIDPVFMIKQGAEWRVMPGITKWDLTRNIAAEKQPDSMKLDQTKQAAFKELDKWVDERKEALQEAQRKQSKP